MKLRYEGAKARRSGHGRLLTDSSVVDSGRGRLLTDSSVVGGGRGLCTHGGRGRLLTDSSVVGGGRGLCTHGGRGRLLTDSSMVGGGRGLWCLQGAVGAGSGAHPDRVAVTVASLVGLQPPLRLLQLTQQVLGGGGRGGVR